MRNRKNMMKNLMIYGWILLGVLCAPAAENLVRNGRFEQLDNNGRPVGWQLGVQNQCLFRLEGVEYVREIPGNSLRMSNFTSRTPGTYGSLKQRITGMVPERKYTLSFVARGRKARGISGIIGRKRNIRLRSGTAAVPESGRQYALTFSLLQDEFEPDGTVPLEIIFEDSAETIWLGDIKITEVKPVVWYPRPRTLQPYAACSHFSADGWNARKNRALQSIHAVQGRGDLWWRIVEPRPGEWDFQYFDRVLEGMEQAGIRPLAILGQNVKFASPAHWHRKEWSDYVTRTVSRYVGRISEYEVWNEQNSEHFWRNPDPGDYADFLRLTYQLVKAVDPQAKVVYGGTAGVPLDYIEASFAAGAVGSFDIMSVHPYHIEGGPELMIPELRELRQLMERYGASDRPIWITEIGWPTANADPMISRGLPLFLKRLGIAPDCTIAVLCDPDETNENPCQYDDGHSIENPIVKIRLEELKQLDVKRFPVLIPCIFRSFPVAGREALEGYLKRGGTLLLASGGTPFFWETHKGADGSFHVRESDYFKKLHIAVESRWGKDGIPPAATRWSLAPEFSSIGPLYSNNRLEFLTADNLKPGDELIPILYGERGNFRGISGAIYKLNSDLKGNLIVLCNSRLMNVSETVQAQLIARTLLIAQACGVERIFPYQIHQSERNPYDKESHFGLFTHELKMKPAAIAYRTTARLCPPGSTCPCLNRRGDLWSAHWETPAGKTISALWSVRNPLSLLLQNPAQFQCMDYLGRRVELHSPVVTISSGPLYFIGNSKLSFFMK